MMHYQRIHGVGVVNSIEDLAAKLSGPNSTS